VKFYPFIIYRPPTHRFEIHGDWVDGQVNLEEVQGFRASDRARGSHGACGYISAGEPTMLLLRDSRDLCVSASPREVAEIMRKYAAGELP